MVPDADLVHKVYKVSKWISHLALCVIFVHTKEFGYFYVTGKGEDIDVSLIFQIGNFQNRWSIFAGSIDLLENSPNSFPKNIKTSALANNECSQIFIQYWHSWENVCSIMSLRAHGL